MTAEQLETLLAYQLPNDLAHYQDRPWEFIGMINHEAMLMKTSCSCASKASGMYETGLTPITEDIPFFLLYRLEFSMLDRLFSAFIGQCNRCQKVKWGLQQVQNDNYLLVDFGKIQL